MNTNELDRLEQDLDAVLGRMGSELRWEQVEPQVRAAAKRPMRRLAGTIGLLVVCLCAGYWTPVGWMVAAGLLLAVLPKRLRAVRERRRALAGIEEGDLFALVRKELKRELAGHFTRSLLYTVLGLLYLVVGLFAADSRPGLAAGAVLLVAAAVHLLWFLPRTSRALRDAKSQEPAS